jgi:hypothetical protein
MGTKTIPTYRAVYEYDKDPREELEKSDTLDLPSASAGKRSLKLQIRRRLYRQEAILGGGGVDSSVLNRNGSNKTSVSENTSLTLRRQPSICLQGLEENLKET